MLLRPTALAIAAALAFAAPTALADSIQTPAAEVQHSATAPAPADHSDSSSYAKREHNDKQVANYRGGSVLVIGISGGALIVILILLLLLA
jgi:hypothetical protein